MEFRLLGNLEVVNEGAPVDVGGTQPRTVLAILLVAGGRVVPALVRQIGDVSPFVVGRVGVGAGGEEELDAREIPVHRRGVQRRPPRRLAHVRVRAGLEEDPDEVRLEPARG